jgi:hypothetical protein
MPGSSLNITLPTVGQTLWGGTLNTILQTIIDDIEASITPDEINVNTNFDFNGYEPTDLGGLSFRNSTSADIRRLYFSGNELWVTDGIGNNIKLTATGSINISSIGEIVGLAGSGASISYSSATTRFTFLSQLLVGASLETGNVRLLKPGSTTIGTTLVASSGQTSDYQITFPSGSAARTNILTFVPSAGDAIITPSRDIQVELIRVTNSGSFNTVNVDSTVTAQTLTANGLVYASGGLVMNGVGNPGSQPLKYHASGTWTPLLYTTATAGTAGSYNNATYSRGWWNRIGDKMELSFDMFLPAVSGTTGLGYLIDIRGLSTSSFSFGQPAEISKHYSWGGNLAICNLTASNVAVDDTINSARPSCYITASYLSGPSTGLEPVIRIHRLMTDFTGSRWTSFSAVNHRDVRLIGSVSYRVG